MTSRVTDLVADAAAELYGEDPASFTARRTALVEAARRAGDAAAAKEIAALRKPTRPAWVLNTLARASPDVPDRLAELAASLRSAAESADGARLRELSAQRSPLVDSLARQALSAVGLADPPAGLREDVVATLDAALADPEVAARFAAGTLTKAEHWAGFGEMVVPPPGASASVRPSRGVPARAPAAGKAAARGPAAGKQQRTPTQAALEEAERQNRRRQGIEDAERHVANAAVVAASAASAENELEDTVRDLEQRLTAARAELADARLRARRAEAAERKARQVLDRVRRGLLAPRAAGPRRPGHRRARWSILHKRVCTTDHRAQPPRTWQCHMRRIHPSGTAFIRPARRGEAAGRKARQVLDLLRRLRGPGAEVNPGRGERSRVFRVESGVGVDLVPGVLLGARPSA
jgi:hypothetical protein